MMVTSVNKDTTINVLPNIVFCHWNIKLLSKRKSKGMFFKRFINSDTTELMLLQPKPWGHLYFNRHTYIFEYFIFQYFTNARQIQKNRDWSRKTSFISYTAKWICLWEMRHARNVQSNGNYPKYPKDRFVILPALVSKVLK